MRRRNGCSIRRSRCSFCSQEQTIAELLAPAGYATGCLGKWHLGGADFGPREQGFDWAFAGKPNTQPSAEEGGKGEYALTEMAEQFIDTNKDRPFFLYLAHDNPHVPLAAKAELVGEARRRPSTRSTRR